MTNRRVCAKCLKNKSLEKFKIRPNGSYGYCYACELVYYRDYNRKRYATPKARKAELKRTRDRYHVLHKPARMERKKTLIGMRGGKCENCGYNKSAAALDFHHREPATKQRTVSHLLAVNQPWAWPMAVKESKKCDLLCSNCHREHTHPGHEL